MAKSLLLKSPTAFTGSARPPLTRDPMIRPGSKFLFDFTDPRCHPGGVITPGALPTGSVFKSLDAVPVSAVATSNINVNADGSVEFLGGGAALNIGAPGQFNMYAAPYEVVYGMHLAFPVSGYSTSNYARLFANGNNANESHIYIDSGVGGLSPRSQWGGTTAIGGTPVPTAIAPGAVVQQAARVDPAVSFNEYRNGAQISTGTGVPSAVPGTNLTSGQMQIGGSVAKFTCYRAFVLDLDTALAQETAWGLSDADKLTGPQHITRDYQFCTNALVAAPKTPFA